MRKVLFSAVLPFIFSGSILAQDEELRGTGFNAPTVTDTEGVANPAQGEIVFVPSGANTGAFYGYAGATDLWHNLSAASTPAGPSTSGIVTDGTTGAQTFGGDKVFNGSITPAGGIVGKTDGVPVAQGYVGETLAATLGSVQTSTSSSPVAISGLSLNLTAGNWLVFAMGTQDFTSFSTGGSTQGYAEIYNSTDGVTLANQSSHIFIGVSPGSVGDSQYGSFSIIHPLIIGSGTKTIVLRHAVAGSGSNTIRTYQNTRLLAVRIQ
ncbi:hypothetical protein [Oligoflexus tunisiensis]|uniref:hypothetical protein n=1 Tax=Oligoflexus tunisiensis TaxID=708132 RepID=UPI00114CC8F4|nr:hypothetical protein [Oligoflexus tunisiensis]